MLDLNRPDDARRYIQSWVELDIAMGSPYGPVSLHDGTDADFLRIAKQLFLYCDPRTPLGKFDEPH
jgi:hypothetical protein